MSIRLLILSMSLTLVLTSCGKKSSGPSDTTSVAPSASPVQQQQDDEDIGSYTAKLAPMNAQIAGNATGEFGLTIDVETVSAQGSMNGVHPEMMHGQIIHPGLACPDEAADTNGDGIIDYVESLAVTGEALIPLDGNLNSQIEGANYSPIANEEGFYVYNKSAAFYNFFEDLMQDDADLEDGYAKISGGRKLKLKGRVLVVYGVHEGTPLPASVQGKDGRSPQSLLPVACGRMIRK